MTAKEFINKLKDLIPDAGKIANIGRSAEYIEQHIIGTFDLAPVSSNYTNSGNEIANLIQNYDTKYKGWLYLELDGMLTDNEEFIRFGSIEADFLLYEPKSKKVYVADHESFGQVEILFDVAKDDTSFLDALIILAEFQMKRFLKEIATDDNEARTKYASKAAEAAGGKAYLKFYESALHVE